MADGTHRSPRERLLGGSVAGVLAGLTMIVCAMIRSAANGMGVWLPLQQAAGVVYGVDSLIAVPGAVWVGLLVHLVTSAAWGAVFGLTFGHMQSITGAFVSGLGYGVLVWAIMTWLILPWANETMAARIELISAWWLGYHLVYGAALCTTPRMVARFATETPVKPAAAERRI